MREVKLEDGKILHMPDTKQREHLEVCGYIFACDCHRRLGNDFWFLPTGSCLRDDKVCNKLSHEE